MNETTAPAPTKRRDVLQIILDIVFPPVCAHCRRLGSLLCVECLGALIPVANPVCHCCGRQINRSNAVPGSALCHECQTEPIPLVQMRAPLQYTEPASTIIHRFKYEGFFALAGPLSNLMADQWPLWSTPPDLVLPIPLHRKRKRHRGYNQSALLAGPLASMRGLEYREDILQRVRHTPPQVGLGHVERAENVRDAFALSEDSIRGRNILLIDDVLTTGATMKSAAAVLLAGGAASVSAYCLARVA